MSKRSTHFNKSWKLRSECSDWLSEGQLTTDAKCVLCDVEFSIAGAGFPQVLQHARGSKHMSKASVTRNQAKLHVSETGTVTTKPGSGQNLCHDDLVTRAEIVLLYRLIKHNFSFSSNDDLTDILKYILPNDDIVRDMSLSSQKSSYSIGYGLGPFYHAELVKDVQKSYFGLIADETTTAQNKKQLDLHVKYWSLDEGRISTRYLNSCYLGHATAENMKEAIIHSLSADGLSLAKMIHFSTDGPNVNKSLKNKLGVAIKELRGQAAVAIGSCTLHIVHNALKTGLSAVQHWAVEEFVLDIFAWFKNFPSRCEDYEELYSTMSNGDTAKKFRRFVDNRWLFLGPVIDRILEQFDTLREFFLKGKFDAAVKDNPRFKRICTQLKFKEATVIHLHVV